MVRRAYPQRTCVGCRARAAASELLRFVAVPRVTGGGESTGVFELVPDPARRMPGRGAHVHLQPACLDRAARRRAFGRALRIPGAIDTERLESYHVLHSSAGPVAPGDTARRSEGSGVNQEAGRPI